MCIPKVKEKIRETDRHRETETEREKSAETERD
jgi:hypothetical protein